MPIYLSRSHPNFKIRFSDFRVFQMWSNSQASINSTIQPIQLFRFVDKEIKRRMGSFVRLYLNISNTALQTNGLIQKDGCMLSSSRLPWCYNSWKWRNNERFPHYFGHPIKTINCQTLIDWLLVNFLVSSLRLRLTWWDSTVPNVVYDFNDLTL